MTQAPLLNNCETIISTGPGANAQDPGGDDESDGAGSETRHLVVDAGRHGLRLDQFLAETVEGFSRSYLKRLIEEGCVQRGGRVQLKASERVRAADSWTIELRATAQSEAFRPEPMVLDAVHEDDDVLVIDKPAGLVVHPAAGNWSGTLLNGLLARDACFRELPRAGIVHRLDKDTSGLMVVARTRRAMDELVRMIAAREVSRRYIALGHGPWQGAEERVVDVPIGRDPRNRLRMAALDAQRHPAKEAMTTLRLIRTVSDACLVEAKLHTGRTHQIRVHMAFTGHPLVGDALYGGRVSWGMNRQALHAWCLAFRHPVSGQELSFQSPVAKDMKAAAEAAGLGPV